MKTTMNVCLNDFVNHYCPSLLKINPNIVLLHSYWPLNRGKSNRRTLMRTAERWPQSLYRGGYVYSIILTKILGVLLLAA